MHTGREERADDAGDDILVVEDTALNREVLLRILQRDGHATRFACTGTEALQRVAERLPVLILLDVRMPDLDGFEVCRRLKADPATRPIPVVFLSGLGDDASRVTGFTVGGVDYVLKPFHAEEVLARVRTHVELRRAQRDLERRNAELRRAHAALEEELGVRRDAEEALRQSEQELRAVWDHVNVGVAVLDRERRVLSVNRRMRDWNPRVDVAARPHCWTSLHDPPRADACPDCPTARTMEDGRVHESVFERPTRDGPRWFRIVSTPLLDAAGRVHAAIELVEDVTERRRAELERRRMDERLVRLQRLESVGTLAGGIAHDINNPLNVILNCADLILADAGGGPAAAHAREISAHGERIAGIVRNLLSFAQHERRPRKPTDVGELVRPVLDLLRAGLENDGIRIDCAVPADLPRPTCHRQQIQQVLVNLVTNARDALDERYPYGDPRKVLRIEALHRPGPGHGHVRITVENDGTEIPPDVQRRIFEPFFTTKPRGIGTGLGLAVSHGIVAEHHGALVLECEPGQPTRFHVDLPVDAVETGPVGTETEGDGG